MKKQHLLLIFIFFNLSIYSQKNRQDEIDSIKKELKLIHPLTEEDIKDHRLQWELDTSGTFEFENQKGKLEITLGELDSIKLGCFNNNECVTPGTHTIGSGSFSIYKDSLQLKSVYAGVISAIFTIPKSGKVLFVKHGKYRLVYTGLDNIYVAKGDTLKQNELIGSYQKVSEYDKSIQMWQTGYLQTKRLNLCEEKWFNFQVEY